MAFSLSLFLIGVKKSGYFSGTVDKAERILQQQKEVEMEMEDMDLFGGTFKGQ